MLISRRGAEKRRNAKTKAWRFRSLKTLALCWIKCKCVFPCVFAALREISI